MRHSSSSSAGADYLDKETVIRALRDAASRASQRMLSIRRVVLFGSLAAGTPTPRSDADLLVVVGRSAHAQPRDRIPELLEALAPLPCDVDLFVLTERELARAVASGAPLVRTALSTGVDLLHGR
jgi:uncharacterized protein